MMISLQSSRLCFEAKRGCSAFCLRALDVRVGIEPAYTALQAVHTILKTYSYSPYPLVLPPRSAWPLRNHSCHATHISPLPKIAVRSASQGSLCSDRTKN